MLLGARRVGPLPAPSGKKQSRSCELGGGKHAPAEKVLRSSPLNAVAVRPHKALAHKGSDTSFHRTLQEMELLAARRRLDGRDGRAPGRLTAATSILPHSGPESWKPARLALVCALRLCSQCVELDFSPGNNSLPRLFKVAHC